MHPQQAHRAVCGCQLQVASHPRLAPGGEPGKDKEGLGFN